MKKGERLNLIYDIKEYLKKFFSSRLFVLSVAIIVMFGILIGRIFYLQIISGASYQENFTMRIQKTLTNNATRGCIYDCNGKLLAYNELAYSVTMTDSGYYATTKQHNLELNAEIATLLDVIHGNGEALYNTFPIVRTEDGKYEFQVSDNSKKRFLADIFGRSSVEDLKYNKDYDFDEANATPEQVLYYLANDSNKFMVDESYDEQTTYEIIVVRYAMFSNRFSKYNATTIAMDVSDETVAYMKEHADELVGVDVAEDTVRRYNDSEYFASIIGYTGRISNEEFESLKETDDSYTLNDIVGKSGLEQYYEKYLRGTNGEREVYVDYVGRISEVISDKESVTGSDLYLSIDSDLQKAVYLLLEQEIAGTVYSNIRTGEIPATDVYFALLNNNVVDINHFSSENASETEQAVYQTFLARQSQVMSWVDAELHSATPTANNDLSEENLEYVNHYITVLKSNGIILSSEIDMNEDTYIKWRAGKISAKEYLQFLISKQWIDISKLSVDEKYADSSEIYEAICTYLQENLVTDKEFSKIMYQYLVRYESVTGRQICLMLFDQGVLDYDGGIVSGLQSGGTSPYSFILEKINNIEITPAQLALDPCTGSCVITDVNTGEIKALVSYPGYDNNRLANGVDAVYYESLREDKSNPQWNYATQEKTAPGSTFKMVTSTAGMAEGVITPDSKITCTAVFREVDNEPKCWIYPHGTHGDINVSEALRDSCNVFYYTLGYNLAMKNTGVYNDPSGIEYIKKYASIYGLNEKTGIEIEENKPEIATEYPVMAAIGQSNNNFTTISLARYVTAVASGKKYNYQLMSKIVDSKGEVLESYSPSSSDITSTLSGDQWSAIRTGMRMMIENMSEYDGFDVACAGKTGTAQQVETRPNHALFVGYAPYDNPEISIATRISYGNSSHNAAAVSRNVIAYYYQKQSLESILSLRAEGVNSSVGNTVTD